MIISPTGEINVAEIARRHELDILAHAQDSPQQPGLFVITDRREFREDEEPDAGERYLRALFQTAASTGVNMEVIRVPSPYDIPGAVTDANRNPDAHGILLPVPLSLELIKDIAQRKAKSDEIIGSIDPSKDVDGLLSVNLPATSEAASDVQRAVEQELGINEAALRVHVHGGHGHVGKGIVRHQEAKGHWVTTSDKTTPQGLTRVLFSNADVIHSATGAAESVTSRFFYQPNAVSGRKILINIGRGNRQSDGKLAGDFHPSTIEMAQQWGWSYTNRGLAVGKLATLLVMRRTVAARDLHPTFEERIPRLSAAHLLA